MVLYAGIEDSADIIADLAHALSCVAGGETAQQAEEAGMRAAL